MKIPKFLEKTVLNSPNIQKKISEVRKNIEQEIRTKYNKETNEHVRKALSVAKKDWASTTASKLGGKVGRSRKYVSTTFNTEFHAKKVDPAKNFDTLYTLFTDSPGSIQSANRIEDAVIGGGYVIKKIEGEEKDAKKSDLKKLIKFFDSPNPDETIELLVGAGIESYLEYGNWFMEKVPTKGSSQSPENMEVAEIYNLDATKMKILVNVEKKKKGVLEKEGYERTADSLKSVIYKLEEVCQIRRTNVKGGLFGRAVLEDNSAMLQLILRALTYNISILSNSGRPPFQVILPEDSNEADAESVSAFIEKNFMGPHNAGKPMVTYKGAEIKTLGITPADMSYLQLFDFGLKLTAGQFGVPLPMIGFPEGTNRATMTETKRNFYYTTVYPLRKLISNKLTKEIIKEGKKIEGWQIDFKGAGLEESEATRRDTVSGFSKGLYRFNEARMKMGLLPVDEKWANEFYLLGSKNDSLMPIKDAIGREPDTGTPEAKKPPEGTSKPGEGADESEE